MNDDVSLPHSFAVEALRAWTDAVAELWHYWPVLVIAIPVAVVLMSVVAFIAAERFDHWQAEQAARRHEQLRR